MPDAIPGLKQLYLPFQHPCLGVPFCLRSRCWIRGVIWMPDTIPGLEAVISSFFNTSALVSFLHQKPLLGSQVSFGC
ncbi:unnamed protein product, partial [Larinioides sclopetarius]